MSHIVNETEFCKYCRRPLRPAETDHHTDCFEAVMGYSPAQTLEEQVKLLMANVHLIPDSKWDVTPRGRKVIWFYEDSAYEDYDWTAERFGITVEGSIVWQFDSGCSCNGPWEDDDGKFECETREVKEMIVEAQTLIPDPSDRYDRDFTLDLFASESMNYIALLLVEAGVIT